MSEKLYDIIDNAFHKKESESDLSIEYCLYVFFDNMEMFARRLAALLLTFGIKLMDVQEFCGIFLKRHFGIIDYVDMKYVIDIDHAQRLLDKIEKKKESSNYKKTGNNRKKKNIKKKDSFTNATFTCLNDKQYKEQRLNLFIDALKKGFIGRETPEIYVRYLFTGFTLEKKQLIIWKGTVGELVYFSRHIKKDMVCPSGEDFWNIIASHFVVKTEYKNGRIKSTPITASSLQHYTDQPKNGMIKKIDDIVSYINMDLQTILNRVQEKMTREEDEEKARDKAESDFVKRLEKR